MAFVSIVVCVHRTERYQTAHVCAYCLGSSPAGSNGGMELPHDNNQAAVSAGTTVCFATGDVVPVRDKPNARTSPQSSVKARARNAAHALSYGTRTGFGQRRVFPEYSTQIRDFCDQFSKHLQRGTKTDDDDNVAPVETSSCAE